MYATEDKCDAYNLDDQEELLNNRTSPQGRTISGATTVNFKHVNSYNKENVASQCDAGDVSTGTNIENILSLSGGCRPQTCT